MLAGSAGSYTPNTPSTMALSVTVLVSGPAVSTLHETGHTPIRLMRPKVGLRPTRLLLLAGCRTEPAVSVPMENRPRDAATADPEPLLDVPGLMSVFQALRLLTGLSWLWPTSETTLPTSTAPASSSSAWIVESCVGTYSVRSASPKIVLTPRVAITSLSVNGTPWSGPRWCPSRISRSATRARSRA